VPHREDVAPGVELGAGRGRVSESRNCQIAKNISTRIPIKISVLELELFDPGFAQEGCIQPLAVSVA
jgi:hypothetical protein